MTDQTIAGLADAVREIAGKMHHHASQEHVRRDAEQYFKFFAKQLDALLSAPPRPTMAHMTDEERHACLWMQCDVAGRRGQWVIAVPCDADGEVGVVSVGGGISWFLPNSITPRPDLPRLEWPGGTPTGPGHLAVGTVIESADDPRIDALPVGSILLDRHKAAAIKGRGEWTGAGYVPIAGDGDEFGPWTVLHIEREADQ